MCGIAGVYDPDWGAKHDLVDRQLTTLLHRGSDAVGAFCRGAGAVGQTRLAVIDLRTGDPPITNGDGTIGVALNGEIYNYRSIRKRLEEAGHRFRSLGDTEVIAHLLESESPLDVARQLDGMFAFAAWDATRKRLVLGRDRLGKKPLYYWCDGSRVVFGSEIKSLLVHPSVPRRLDLGVIPDYLRFGYVPTPRTFFQGIVGLPPGCILTASEVGLTVQPYWDADLLPPADIDDPDEAISLVRAGLWRAVEKRLIADVPIGAFLSGGVDSAAIVAAMADLTPGRVRTFTIGFADQEGFDERPAARMVARHFGTEHTELQVDPDAVELLEHLVNLHDQPFGDSSAVPTYLLSKLIRPHVTVALSGDGGDELFAGYERFSAALFFDRWRRLPAPLRQRVARLVGVRAASGAKSRLRSLQRFLSGDGETFDSYLGWVSLLDDDRLGRLLGHAAEAPRHYRQYWEHSEGRPLLDRLLDLNLRTYLLDDLLVKADRGSMGAGLELRSPLLDDDLLAISKRLAPRLKANGWQRKITLRRVLDGLVPRQVLHGRKRGFAVPIDRWLRGSLSSYVEAMLLSEKSRAGHYLNRDALRVLVGEQRSGEHHGQALWALLTLEAFLRREGW